MKKTLTSLLILFAITANTAHANWFSKLFQKAVEGNGALEEQTYQFDSLTGLHIHEDYPITIEYARSPSLSITADSNLHEHLIPIYHSGVITIKTEQKIDPSQPIFITVKTPELQLLTLSGTSASVSGSGVKSDKLFIQINGQGYVQLDKLSAKHVSTEINGLGEVEYSGNSQQQDITIKGSGSVTAHRLKAENTTIKIYGSGNVDTLTEDNLNVYIAGSGTVRYLGDAHIVQSIKGFGKVEKLPEVN